MSDVFEHFAATVPKPSTPLGQKQSKFWREEDPEVDGEGKDKKLTKGGMLPPQREWWHLPNFVKILVGGFGAGKTVITSKRAIALAIQNAPAPHALVSPTFPLARHTTIPTIEALLAGKQTLYGSRQFWWRYNRSTHEFKIRFKGRAAHIIIYSGENPLSLRGPNLGSAGIDEPFIQQKAVFDQMVARVRHPDARVKEIGLTGTPEQLNWGYDLAVGEDKDMHDVGVVHAPTRSNFVIDDNYANRLEGAFTGKAADAYVEGRFVQLSTGLVYYGFQGLGSANVQRINIPPGAQLGCGMDFNVQPFAFLVFWRAGSHMHIVKEYELDNADTEYACSLLRAHWVETGPERMVGKDYTLHTVYPDETGKNRHTSSPGGKSDHFYIKAAGFEVRVGTSNPLQRDREEAINGKFHPKSGFPTLTVDPSCKKVIKYLSTYSHELKHKPEQKAMSHLLDALGYPVAYLFPIVKEKLRVHPISGV